MGQIFQFVTLIESSGHDSGQALIETAILTLKKIFTSTCFNNSLLIPNVKRIGFSGLGCMLII